MKDFGEKEFQNELIYKFQHLGWKVVVLKTNLVDKAFNDVSLRDFLTKKYGISNDEFNEISNAILSQLNRSNWFENNKKALTDMLKNGVATDRTKKENKAPYQLFDSINLENNIFEISEEVWISNSSRMDLVLFMNGLPIFCFELKNLFKPNATKSNAFEQIKGYLSNDNQLFATFNIAQIVSKDYSDTLVGSISSNIDRWFSLSKDPLKATNTFFDFFDFEKLINYIKFGVLFSSGKKTNKFILKHHQYDAIIAIKNSLLKKESGYIWHTQGSGKSITIAGLVSCMTRVSDLSSITTIVDVDRVDLVDNIFQTFKSIDPEHFDDQDIKTARSAQDLQEYLTNRKFRGIIVTTTQKFKDSGILSKRDDLLLISDEAHRSHFEDGKPEKITYLDKINKALPNVMKIGFTGTPIFESDKSTYAQFGEMLHKYTMKQAELDGVIVPIEVSMILGRVDLKKENIKSSDKKITNQSRYISEAPDRIDFITDEIKESFIYQKNSHISFRRKDTFKAMVVTESKTSGFKIYNSLLKKIFNGDQSKIKYVVSFSQDSAERDRTNADVNEYVSKNEKLKSMWIEEFKKNDSSIEIMVVVDMLLTGYDVPNLSFMYIDKNIRMHNLLQAIARVNRKSPDKQNGFIISFRDIKSDLEDALRVYRDTTNDNSELITISVEAETVIREMVDSLNAKYDAFNNFDFNEIGFESNKLKEKFFNKEDFIMIVKNIIRVSSLVNKWNDIELKKIVAACKIIMAATKATDDYYIDITKEEFEHIVNSIIVNRDFIKRVNIQSLDDLIIAKMPEEDIISKILSKISVVIKGDISLIEDEKVSLIKQLEDIISKYNKSNFDEIIKEIRRFESSLNENINVSNVTKILLREFKSKMKMTLNDNAKKEIDDFSKKLSAVQTPGDAKSIKSELRNILKKHYQNEGIISEIIINNWAEIVSAIKESYEHK